jgi:hypothetical protein
MNKFKGKQAAMRDKKFLTITPAMPLSFAFLPSGGIAAHGNNAIGGN